MIGAEGESKKTAKLARQESFSNWGRSGTRPVDPFTLVDTRLTDHFFKGLYRVTAMRKVHFHDLVRFAGCGRFDPGLMRTLASFQEGESVISQKLYEIGIAPIV